MKIAMIIARYPPVAGGAEIQCQRLSATLVVKGHDVTVLTENRSPDTRYEERQDGVRVIRMPTRGIPPWSSFVFVLKLWKFLRQNRFDIIHAHLIAMPAIFALVWGRRHGIPVLIKTAGAGPTGDIATSMRKIIRGRLKLYLFKRWVNSAIAPSGRARQELIEVGLRESQVYLIPNGVDFHRFRPVTAQDRRQARLQFSLPADDPIAIYAGRWAHGKNLELLLDTWQAGVAHPGFKWKLVLVIGGGGVPDAIRKRLNGLKGHVFVFENIDDLLPYYHAADLAILLSTGEGLSNFLLETMACGLPALTSESAAITTAASHEHWSWVIADAELSTPSLIHFFMEKAPAQDKLFVMGSAARQHVENGFSLDAVATMYETLYKHCVNDAPL